MNYFWNKTTGLKADIERHRAQEKELETKIAQLELQIQEGKADKFTDMYLRTYRNFLCQLQLSKADVVTKIGKKK